MYLEYTKPKPIDWTVTYSAKDKIPFGAYVLYKEMPKLFPDKKIDLIEETPASHLDKYNSDSDNFYFIINKDPISDADTDLLLDFVHNGNDVFLVSTHIPEEILKELNLDTETTYYVLNKDFSNVQMYLTNPSFQNTKYKFEKITRFAYFKKIDTINSVILGEFTNSGKKRVNFIKQKYGKGYFYLHLFPEAFSNYFMLKDNYTYAVNSLNYPNKRTILWDEYKKSIKTPPEGIMMYIYANPPLVWAWRILLTGVIFYVIFFGKRLQRIIPIIKPLTNTTVEFTKTIGNLYYNSREHQDIIDKKIKYFLYFVKGRYFMDIEIIDENFSEKLHLKSGVSREITDKIVSLIQKNQHSSSSSEEDLKIINKTIDLFYKKI
jgi:hypothetical protein